VHRFKNSAPAHTGWIEQVKPHVFGHLPSGRSVKERTS
jgi:hypothetical protein